MNSSDNKIEVQFGARTAELDTACKQVSAHMQTIAQTAQKSSEQVASAWSGFGNVFAGVARALNGSMQGTGKAAEGMASTGANAFGAIANASTQMRTTINGSMASVASSISRVRGLWVGLAAVAGGAMFKGAIKDAAEWDGQVIKLSKTLGISSVDASTLAVALDHLGVSQDSMIQGSFMISRQIRTNAEAFEALGVKVKDTETGAFRPVAEVMAEVNQKLRDIHNPILQNQAGMLVYGRSWQELKPLLKLNAQEMSNAEKRAQELGLVVGPEGAAKSRQYKEAMNDVNLVGKSISIQFGNELMPVFTRAGQWMAGEGPVLAKTFATCIEAIAFAASSAWLALKDMGDGIGAVFAQTGALLRGDIAGFKAIGKARDEEYAKNNAAYEALKAKFGKPLPAPKIEKTGDDNGFVPVLPGGKSGHGRKAHKEKNDPSNMNKYELELENQKLAFSEKNQGREMDKEAEFAFWEAKLAIVKAGSDDHRAIEKKLIQDRLAILREGRKNGIAETKEGADEMERLKIAGLAIDEENANQQLALGQITKTQLLAQQKTFEDLRYEIQREAQAKRIALLRKEDDPAAYMAANEKLLELDRARNLKKLQIDHQLQTQESPIWKGISTSMSSLWDKGVNAMMNGTLRWKNALRATWMELGGMFANTVIKPIVANWAKSLATMIAQKMGWAATDKGIEQGAANASTSATVTSATTKLSANAVTAGTGAASAMANIPYVGPILAAAAMASMFASVMAMGSSIKSASGGYDIPSGLNPVTQLHEEEMVLPKGIANPMRKMLAGGGLGGGQQEAAPVQAGDVHYHDYSGRLTKSQIRENAATIATELNRLHRDGWRPK